MNGLDKSDSGRLTCRPLWHRLRMERLAVLHPFTSNLQAVLQDFEDVDNSIFALSLSPSRLPDSGCLCTGRSGEMQQLGLGLRTLSKTDEDKQSLARCGRKVKQMQTLAGGGDRGRLCAIEWCFAEAQSQSQQIQGDKVSKSSWYDVIRCARQGSASLETLFLPTQPSLSLPSLPWLMPSQTKT